jgi:hypothetical protein
VIRQFQKQLTDRGGSLQCESPPLACYLSHVGFYHHINYSFGRELGEVRGNANYFPIKGKNTGDFGHPADRDGVIREINKFSEQLSNFLLLNKPGPTKNVVAYVIREICRNVVDHSRSNTIWHIGQYYPKNSEIEIAILDEGIGIRRSLSRNPDFRYVTDNEAITKALQRGVSGAVPKDEEEEFRGSYDVEHNSGLGLYIVSEICKAQGSFTILSGEGCFDASGGRQNWWESWLHGTALRLRLNTNSLQELDQQFIRLGVQNTRAKSAIGFK